MKTKLALAAMGLLLLAACGPYKPAGPSGSGTISQNSMEYGWLTTPAIPAAK